MFNVHLAEFNMNVDLTVQAHWLQWAYRGGKRHIVHLSQINRDYRNLPEELSITKCQNLPRSVNHSDFIHSILLTKT